MARGGYRPNSGPAKGTKYSPRGTRKKAEKKKDIPQDIKDQAAAVNMTPLEYMLKVMNDPNEDKEIRARMAIAAAPFVHSRKGDGKGKKEERDDKAKAASVSGRFGTGAPPVRVVK